MQSRDAGDQLLFDCSRHIGRLLETHCSQMFKRYKLTHPFQRVIVILPLLSSTNSRAYCTSLQMGYGSPSPCPHCTELSNNLQPQLLHDNTWFHCWNMCRWKTGMFSWLMINIFVQHRVICGTFHIVSLNKMVIDVNETLLKTHI